MQKKYAFASLVFGAITKPHTPAWCSKTTKHIFQCIQFVDPFIDCSMIDRHWTKDKIIISLKCEVHSEATHCPSSIELTVNKNWMNLPNLCEYRNRILWNIFLSCWFFCTIWPICDWLVFCADCILTCSNKHVVCTRESVSSVLINIYCVHPRTAAEELLPEMYFSCVLSLFLKLFFTGVAKVRSSCHHPSYYSVSVSGMTFPRPGPPLIF